jgi:hypothetical protein
MGERTPLPSSVTLPHVREASPVATSQEAQKPDYSRQKKYAKTEKGKKVHREASKRWNREHRKYQPKGISRSEGVKLWWQRRKQQQSQEQQQ